MRRRGYPIIKFTEYDVAIPIELDDASKHHGRAGAGLRGRLFAILIELDDASTQPHEIIIP